MATSNKSVVPPGYWEVDRKPDDATGLFSLTLEEAEDSLLRSIPQTAEAPQAIRFTRREITALCAALEQHGSAVFNGLRPEHWTESGFVGPVFLSKLLCLGWGIHEPELFCGRAKGAICRILQCKPEALTRSALKQAVQRKGLRPGLMGYGPVAHKQVCAWAGVPQRISADSFTIGRRWKFDPFTGRPFKGKARH